MSNSKKVRDALASRDADVIEEMLGEMEETSGVVVMAGTSDAAIKLDDNKWQKYINERFVVFELRKDKRLYPVICLENTLSLLKFGGISVGYNEMSKENEITIPGQDFHRDRKANSQLSWLYNFCRTNQYKIEEGQLDKHLDKIGDDHAFHPVKEMIAANPWDGVSRLSDLFETIETDDTALRDLIMRRWMVSAIAAVYLPRGISSQGALVFQGAQGKKKTRWLASIAGNRDWVSEGEHLVTGDKDSVARCVSKWIVELGEIETTFRKQDIGALKAFITKSNDNFRPPYARKANDYDRRTVFFGSVNDEHFLVDKTSNRRFWTIAITQCHLYTGDVGQLWSEVYQLFLASEPYWLVDDEQRQIDESNEKFEVVSAIEEIVRTRFKPAEAFTAKDRVVVKSLKASDIGKLVLDKVPNLVESRSIGDALRKIGAKMNKNDRTYKLIDREDMANKVAWDKVSVKLKIVEDKFYE